MNTPTHALVALAALSKREDRARNLWVLAGGLIPDLAIFLWAPWQRWGLGRDWSAIWRDHYFEPPMQTLIALFNSVPIYAALALVGWTARATRWGGLLLVFSLAALLHIALDLPVHAHDAYRHFWPLSDWRFHSPISYWESHLGARWVSVAELAICAVCAWVLWPRFTAGWVRGLIILCLAVAVVNAGAQQLAAHFDVA
ncbi:MAG: hypothetical protein AAF311_03220 [Pseudomonadota bacterium]